MTVEWTVTNTGPGAAQAPWVDLVYLSASGTLAGATLLASVTRASDLAPQGRYDAQAPVLLPAVADGAYRFLVVTDGAGAVFEQAGEDNNLRASDAAGELVLAVGGLGWLRIPVSPAGR